MSRCHCFLANWHNFESDKKVKHFLLGSPGHFRLEDVSAEFTGVVKRHAYSHDHRIPNKAGCVRSHDLIVTDVTHTERLV